MRTIILSNGKDRQGAFGWVTATRALIAEPQSGVEVGQAASDIPGRVCLRVEIDFELRLQYQALSEVQIVRALDSSRDASSIANRQCWFNTEESRTLLSCRPQQ